MSFLLSSSAAAASTASASARARFLSASFNRSASVLRRALSSRNRAQLTAAELQLRVEQPSLLEAAFPGLSRALRGSVLQFSEGGSKGFRNFFPKRGGNSGKKGETSSSSTSKSAKDMSGKKGEGAARDSSKASSSGSGGGGGEKFPPRIRHERVSVERDSVVGGNPSHFVRLRARKGCPERDHVGRVQQRYAFQGARRSSCCRQQNEVRSVPPRVVEESFQNDDDINQSAANSNGTVYANRVGSPSAAKGAERFYFTIGSVESFEQKLEAAQRAIGISPHDYIAVQYTAEVEWFKSIMGVVPTLLMLGAFAFFLTRMGPGGAGGRGNNIFSIGKANAKQFDGELKNVKFKDVAGCNEAKREIMEFVDFLKNPKQFTDVGAKIPKGALLYGPPGTGKTLLAKAAAGEASVPFFTMSGSDFIEMFVGVGPSRVRDSSSRRARRPRASFSWTKSTLSRAREAKEAFSGGNDERENTLNQLLVEMDGFNTTEGIVVIAGTNRLDILDQAILRPGRFDRQIKVDLPDIRGRSDIFKVHLDGLKLDGGADAMGEIAKRLAALTPGFSGADIANLCNEAAIFAAREKKKFVDMTSFDKAVDRVIGGLEKTSLMSKEEKRTVAYHEAGHAVAGWFLEHADPLLKVTIIPRMSGALGFAQYLPKEMALHTREQLTDRMCMALGGRVAEELTFGRITTGAQDDLDKVTKIAYSMVSMFGMNDSVGRVSFNVNAEENQFKKPYSEATAEKIDEEVKAIIEGAYERTTQLLMEKKQAVAAVAEYLLENETITQHDVERLIGARPFEAPQSYKEFVAASGDSMADSSQSDEENAGADTGADAGEMRRRARRRTVAWAATPSLRYKHR